MLIHAAFLWKFLFSGTSLQTVTEIDSLHEMDQDNVLQKVNNVCCMAGQPNFVIISLSLY